MATSRGPQQNEKINNGWRVHPVHCPVRLHYRKWRCLNEIFIETLSADRKCFNTTKQQMLTEYRLMNNSSLQSLDLSNQIDE